MLTRAMNLDTLDDVEAAKGGGQDDELPTGGRGAMLAELSVDLDEYKSVEQDIDTITVALDQIDAQSSELKNMLQGLLISQEMARAQHDDGATSSGVDSAVEGQPSASSADSSDVDLDPGKMTPTSFIRGLGWVGLDAEAEAEAHVSCLWGFLFRGGV